MINNLGINQNKKKNQGKKSQELGSEARKPTYWLGALSLRPLAPRGCIQHRAAAPSPSHGQRVQEQRRARLPSPPPQGPLLLGRMETLHFLGQAFDLEAMRREAAGTISYF